ncbi:MAG TPA: site-specific integrase [Candidatus Sulfotelmatobacter sp.]
MSEKISEKTVKNLTPPKHGNRILYDAQIPGFGVRITAAGAVGFILNYHVHGRERRFTIGKHPELSVIAARNRALELRRKVNEGIDPLEEREQDRAQPTMNDLCVDYLEHHALVHKRPHSVRDDKQMIAGVIAPKMGSLRVSAVSRQGVAKLHASLKATPYFANRVLALLSKMFSLAIEWHWVSSNPAQGIPRFHEDRRERWLQPEELRRFVEGLNAYHNQNVADAFRLLLLTGSRKSEVLMAEWPMFDLEQGLWTKPSSHTKEKQIEHNPLSVQALQLLAKMKEQGDGAGFLFPGLSGKPRTTLRVAWSQICKAAGLSNIRVHDLRHSYASYLVSHGVSLHVVGKLLGHSQAQTTQRYAHVAHQSLRDASNLFGNIFQTANKQN